jgi:hypothetical protein
LPNLDSKRLVLKKTYRCFRSPHRQHSRGSARRVRQDPELHQDQRGRHLPQARRQGLDRR